LIIDSKTVSATKTNLTAKGSGITGSSNNLPGVVSVKVGGAFKPATK
jgi:hypothetical protein